MPMMYACDVWLSYQNSIKSLQIMNISCYKFNAIVNVIGTEDVQHSGHMKSGMQAHDCILRNNCLDAWRG